MTRFRRLTDADELCSWRILSCAGDLVNEYDLNFTIMYWPQEEENVLPMMPVLSG